MWAYLLVGAKGNTGLAALVPGGACHGGQLVVSGMYLFLL